VGENVVIYDEWLKVYWGRRQKAESRKQKAEGGG
jgi:hypothetical protein